MHKIFQDLLIESPVILDGGWGTCFQDQGLAVGVSPESWNLEKPEAVLAIARAYVEAGSRIILTNTFGANPIMLANHGLADKASEINRIGVELSKEAAGEDTLVFASIGPSGSIVMMEEHTKAEFFDAFRRQAEALATGGADGLLIETFADLEEAELAVKAAAETKLPLVCSMVFDGRSGGEFTIMGQTAEQCAETLLAAGADIVGTNCGQGIESFAAICKRLHETTRLPVWAKPNAGIPQIIDGKTKFVQPPEEFASHAPDLLAAGVSFIGGCCGTRPDFIRMLKQTLMHLK